MELLGVVHQRREKTNKNKRNISSLVVCDDESSWEETWKTQKTQARIEWKCDQLLRQRRLRYSFMYVRGGRQTMINAIPSGSLSLLFLSNLFIPFFFFLVLLLVFLSLAHQLASIQHATPWCIFFFVRATFVLLFAYSFEECWCGGKNNNPKNVAKAYFKKIPHHGHISSLPLFSLHYNNPPASLHYINRYRYVLGLLFPPLSLSDSFLPRYKCVPSYIVCVGTLRRRPLGI